MSSSSSSSSINDDVDKKQEIKNNENMKNKAKICCRFCPSLILNIGTSTFIPHEFSLPHMTSKDKDKDEKLEIIKDYWLVEDLYDFENVTVTKTLDQIKYLACTDCEMGPIGYMNLTTKKSYVAVSRVMYKDNT